MLCSLGCGQEAIAFSKSGKRGWCNVSCNRCPAKIERDRSKKIGINPFKLKNIPHPRGNLGKPSPQKGKTIEELYGLEKASDIKKKLSKNSSKHHKYRDSVEYRLLRSKIAKKNKLGGVTKGGGRGKHGWYKGIWCDSSWELAWVIFHLEHNIPFIRNNQGFDYFFNGKVRKYFPDFILNDGSYVEIKGYDSEQFKAKRLQFKGSLKIYMKNEMENILKYVIGRYGKNFITLYSGE